MLFLNNVIIKLFHCHCHSHHNNHTHNIGYYNNLTNRPRTTTGLLTPQTHRPSNKSERNLIILQVNINGLRNKLEELKLLIHDPHADIITIQETKLTPKAKNITSQQCALIGCTRQEVGSLHSLETTSHSLQQTYLRLLIHTTQRTTNSRCHQQLGPHNTKHKHPNQSVKQHTTRNIITIHHHGV